MKMNKFLLRGLFAVQLIAVTFVVSANTTSQFVVTTSTYSANSAEKQAIMAWLQQHAERVRGHLIGEFERVGDVTVIYSRDVALDRYVVQSPGDGPPASLPLSGHPGDTFSVSSCSSGVSQTWSYTWTSNFSGGGWKLTNYKYVTKSCDSGSGGA
ncbi:hypothetical protein [Xanthomonas albilineans]|uniref:hypothetical protein n=1 Tax=Xanthomonas albilineans TaxID=29447 RepID=UPI0012D46187|nr:hypothetical protein [Xanthomonas albilineans]